MLRRSIPGRARRHSGLQHYWDILATRSFRTSTVRCAVIMSNIAAPARRLDVNLKISVPRSITTVGKGCAAQSSRSFCPRPRWRARGGSLAKGRRSRQHIARFILLALYTGTRAGAICGAALQPTVGRGWIDIARGVFYRRPEGERETKKRKPPVPLPPELHGHLRRWKRH